MELIKGFINKNELLVGSLIILVCWLGFFLFTGTINSGYHLTDDHEIISMHEDLTSNQLGFWGTLKKWVTNDFKIRFRPFYYVHKMVEVKMFGTNYFMWSIYAALMAILTSILLFAFGRAIKLPMMVSLLFVLLTIIGEQSAIWWKLGPAETVGMFLLSLSLFFASKSASLASNKKAYNLLFVVSAILMSLAKENFLLFIPSLLLLKIWLDVEYFKDGWLEVLKANCAIIAFLLLAMLAELWLIKNYVGTMNIGYAGWYGFKWRGFLSVGRGYLYRGDFLIALILPLLFLGKNCLDLGRKMIPGLCLFLVIIIPQMLLYLKSGVNERYLLPGLVAFSLLAVLVYEQIYKYSRRLGLMALILIIIVCVSKGVKMINQANAFTNEGKETRLLFDLINKNTNPNDCILVVIDPVTRYEWSWSFRKYLNSGIIKRENLYLKTIKRDNYNDYEKIISSDPERWYAPKILGKVKDKSIFKCVIIFPGFDLENEFEKSETWFHKNDFERHCQAGFVIYLINNPED